MPRPAGSPNKNKRAIQARLRLLLGDDFNPVLKMAEMAMNVHKSAIETGDIQDQKEAVNCWDKVAQYVEPKLKSTELTTIDKDGEVTGFSITFADAAKSDAAK